MGKQLGRESTSLPDSVNQVGLAVSAHRITILLSGLISVVIVSFALWYTSSGKFPHFPRIQNDYIALGAAFLRGQLSLLDQPDPRLMALSNPYEYRQRRNIPYHWDASLYRGKYYLYWGPVPAMISAGIQAVCGTPPFASVLVVLAYIGLLGVFWALLVHLFKLFQLGDSRYSIWPFLVIGFFNLPLLFVIGQPRHYQASILYGQLFLLLGLLCYVLYLGSGRWFWLALAGLSWGLSLACRYNLVFSVVWYLLIALVQFTREKEQKKYFRIVLLLTPLVLCLFGLGIYNFARFGNPLETGLTYQLTIPEFHKVSYSLSYLPSNLYIYLAYPLTGATAFPFIASAHFRLTLLPEWLVLPAGREFDQVVFGLLRSVPAVWLVILIIPFIYRMIVSSPRRQALPQRVLQRFSIFTLIAPAAAGQFLFLMIFFYAAERYIADFYLPLVLCIAIAIWYIDEQLQAARGGRVLLWTIVIGLAICTAGIGYFGCFGIPTLVSNFFEPAMLSRIASFWNLRYAELQHLMFWHH